MTRLFRNAVARITRWLESIDPCQEIPGGDPE